MGNAVLQGPGLQWYVGVADIFFVLAIDRLLALRSSSINSLHGFASSVGAPVPALCHSC